MRGAKKPETLKKLNRLNVLPFYLSEELQELYDQDEYKYLIHLLKCNPNDEHRILQYLLLKFHPLIIKTCSKYSKLIPMDWMDLIGFGRYAFIELIYRFNLGGTLYFRTYIPLALSRALNDLYVYLSRRWGMNSATSLDTCSDYVQEFLRSTDYVTSNHTNTETMAIWEGHTDVGDEIKGYVLGLVTFPLIHRKIYLEATLGGVGAKKIAAREQVEPEEIERILELIGVLVRKHLKRNYL